MTAPGAPLHRRPRPGVTAVGVLVAVVASLLWWDAAGQVIGPGGSHDAHGQGPRGLTVQAAAGRAIVGHWRPPQDGPAPASYRVRVVAGDSGHTVATTDTWSSSVVVGGLDTGRPYRMAVTAGGAEQVSGPITVLADQRPDPPAAVMIAQQPATDTIQVRWSPAATGVAATGAIVAVYDGLGYRGSLTCQAECTSAALRGLPYGRAYTVRVAPLNRAGQGPAASSNALDLSSPCVAAATCVTIDGTKAMAPARLRAQGFLNSLYPVGAMVDRVRALRPYTWRGAPTYHAATASFDWSSWDVAVATGAPTTLLLSNLWQAGTDTGSGARPPWSDWAGYGAWVTATVRAIEASGHPVSYWEIQNEPAGPGYYSPADWAAATPGDYLEQFRVAYSAIKAADPSAAIIGPSLSHFADYPGQFDDHEPDLVTFLDFAARFGLRLAALTWHEIDDNLGPRPREFSNQPQIIGDHVAEARSLIAARPALGAPQVWVNEYGHRMDYAIPGWTLGDIAALEQAPVDGASRSCWQEQGTDGMPVDDCPSPTLDGLLATDGATPRANFWVYATYAQMKGRLVATTSSDTTVSVLAARNDVANQVIAMIGRHVSCLPGVNHNCTQLSAALPPPQAALAAMRVPWPGAHQVTASITRVPATWGPVAQPASVFQGPLAVTSGVVLMPLPAMADGEVYLVTVTR